MNKNRRTQLAHGAVSATLTVVLMMVARFVSGFSVITVLLTGLPIAFLGTRHGTRISALTAIVSVLVLALVTGDILSTLLLGALHLLPGLGIGYALSHRKGYYGALLYGSTGVLAGLLLQILALNFLNGGNGFAQLISGTLQETEAMMQQLISRMDGNNAQEMMATAENVLKVAEQQFMLYLPTMLIAISAVLGYATVAVALFMLKRLKIKRVSYLRFSELIAPRSVCYLSVLLSIFAMMQREITVFAAGILNLSMLLELFLAVCGLSLIDAKLEKKISAGVARGGVYLAVFLVGYLFLGMLFRVLSLLGMIDGLFGFRYGKKGENHGEEK
ncbi:MAG: DUF2232 domain-containing protein [Clostridia bacterium]|nr:DUF2232 domain-containing protein [Clostridia bacterium]